MEEQPKITGYRQLSEEEIALVNEAKALAEEVGKFVDKLRSYEVFDPRHRPPIAQRWVSIGATELQLGFMALTRAIARPTTF